MSVQRVNALGGYEDWPAYLDQAPPATGGGLWDVLRPPTPPEQVPLRYGRTSTADGVRTQLLSWQLGYGPRTQAYLCTPEQGTGPLPAIVLMHCHSGNKYVGAERLVDLGAANTSEAGALRARMYGGHAVANHLAAQGFAVLAHDAFAWGSRRFTFDPPPMRSALHLRGQMALWREEGTPATPERIYNALAADHEHTVAKTATMLGTTLAGMVAHDDLAALTVLRSMDGIDPTRIGTMGLSGGGGRAMMLAALSPHIRAHLVAGMMFTFDSLIPTHLDSHSWLVYIPGLRQYADWPLIPTRAPRRQVMRVQYARQDELFTTAGMTQADAMLQAHSPHQVDYSSAWFDEPHRMTPMMQQDAADFFTRALAD